MNANLFDYDRASHTVHSETIDMSTPEGQERFRHVMEFIKCVRRMADGEID